MKSGPQQSRRNQSFIYVIRIDLKLLALKDQTVEQPHKLLKLMAKDVYTQPLRYGKNAIQCQSLSDVLIV